MSVGRSDPMMRETLADQKSACDGGRVARVVNQYLFLDKIGEGSDSKVFLAEDMQSQKLFAAKAFSLPRKNSIEHLENELKVLRRAKHASIIGLNEVLKAKSKVFLIMEYADAGSLQGQIDSGRKFSDSELSSLFISVIDALIFLRSKGFIHRDVKPANILLFSDGRAKLSDFGVGTSVGEEEAHISSPAYQAPEIFDESMENEYIDPVKEEVWSLGVSLYQTAFGKLPFAGENAYEIARSALNTELLIPEAASAELKSLLKAMLCVNPQKRPSLEELVLTKFFSTREKCYLRPAKNSLAEICKVVVEKAEICGENYTFEHPQNRSLQLAPMSKAEILI